jgi:trans-aconitate 2-methyltransferase
MTWDPDQYLRFADERALPFRHLIAAVADADPGFVVDLGCGTGKLTASLLQRWLQAKVVGIDASEEMIGHARRLATPDLLYFEVARVERWRASEPIDLIVANASFHWVDDHHALFDHLLPQLAGSGALAFQVPANHTEPSHTVLQELCASPHWRNRLGGLPRTSVREPRWYLDELGSRGLDVTAWQTTYFHVLEGEDLVLEWVRGTTLRPVFERLPEDEHGEFLAAYGKKLRQAYPSHDGRTVFPFRRNFVVARFTP